MRQRAVAGENARRRSPATPTAVLVAEQNAKKIYKLAVPGFAASTVATVPSADLLGCCRTAICSPAAPASTRITQASAVTTILTGFVRPLER